jgi:hypothetical protein
MKYLNKSFTVLALKAEDWERIFGKNKKPKECLKKEAISAETPKAISNYR